MKHLEVAKQSMPTRLHEFIETEGGSVTFTMQNLPVGVVGVTGVQVTDILAYVKELFASLNSVFPCQENVDTMENISTALAHQDARTAKRVASGVEGQNKAVPTMNLEEANAQEVLDAEYITFEMSKLDILHEDKECEDCDQTCTDKQGESNCALGGESKPPVDDEV